MKGIGANPVNTLLNNFIWQEEENKKNNKVYVGDDEASFESGRDRWKTKIIMLFLYKMKNRNQNNQCVQTWPRDIFCQLYVTSYTSPRSMNLRKLM